MALFSKVFGNESLQSPYKSEDEVLTEIVKIYKEKEPSLNWLDRDLKNFQKMWKKQMRMMMNDFNVWQKTALFT
jgi:hypothetical protein